MLESDKIVYTFGKHKGESLRYVLENDSSYFSWSYYNAPQFQKMIEGLDEELIRCIKIAAYNETIKQHNRKIRHCMQQDSYLKNPKFFKYFKEPKEKETPYYSYQDCLYDENDDTFNQQDSDMNNNF